MVKRIISFGVMLLLMFSLAACNNGGGEVPDKELLEYKSSAKTEIGDYALDKGQENYTTENWLIILDIVTKCKEDIGSAVDKEEVDALLIAAKAAIDECEVKAGMGIFYTLQEAYDEELLTVEDLRSIAYYYHNSDDDSYIPTPKNPASLNTKTENKIKQEYLNTLNIPQSLIDVNPNGIQLLDYYGTYKNVIVIKITDNYIPKDLQPINYDVVGIIFNDYIFNVRVWKLL